MKIIKKNKEVLLIVFSVFFLVLGFYNNSLKVCSQNWFNNFQIDSESLVIGRLIMSQQDGLFSQSGLSGRILDIPAGKKPHLYQYELYKNEQKVNPDKFWTYKSQIGGQALVLSLLEPILPVSNTKKLKIFYFLNSLLLGFVFSFFIWFLYKNYGIGTALITLFLISISPWVIVFGRNLYWFLWVLYIPFIILLYFLFKESKRNHANNKQLMLSLQKLAIISFCLIFFKLIFTGFELITTVLVMFTTPLVFYASLDKWDFKVLFQRFFVLTTSSVTAIISYFFILSFQLSFVLGDFSKGFDHIFSSFLRRSSGNSTDFPKVFKDSLEASVSEVLEKYWNGIAINLNPFINTEWNSFFVIDFGEMIILFLLFSALLFISKTFSHSLFNDRRSNIALFFTTWVSLLAPLSWLIIFKGHSYKHTHVNFIIWYMPFCLFGFALVGSVISSLVKDIFNYYIKNRIGRFKN